MQDLSIAPSGWTFVSNPDAASFGNGRVDVFANASNGSTVRVFHRVMTLTDGGSWAQLPAPPAAIVGGVSAVSWGPKRLDVFVVGGNQVRHAYSTDGTGFTWDSTAWGAPSGVTIVGDPDASAWMPGRIDVFVTDSSGTVWDGASSDVQPGTGATPPWYAWTPGYLTSSPSSVALGDGRLIVSARGGSPYQPYIRGYNYNFLPAGWQNMQGYILGGLDYSSW